MAKQSLSVGIAGLNDALVDGIPAGYTMLVYGQPGNGMELFAKQFSSGAKPEENVAYIATDELDEDVAATMQKFGWTTKMRIINIGTEYYETVLARRLEFSRYRQEGLTLKDMRQVKPTEVSPDSVNLLTKLTYEISQLQPPFRIIINSLDFFLNFYEHGEVLSALRTIKAHTQHNNGVALITMLEGVYGTRTQSGIEGIVDVIIELERVRDGLDYKRNLLIRKVRNNPGRTRIMPYSLTNAGFVPEK